MSINSKFEILNPKQFQITKTQNPKQYNLEERTFKFTQNVIAYVNDLPKGLANIEVAKQVVRSSGSVGANYIEANEALSRKDFILRIKISRKEAKESRYWIKLTEPKENSIKQKENLAKEATELMKIFGSILEKSK